MPEIFVKTGNGMVGFPFEKGRSLRNILDTTDMRVRAGCNGTGVCGLCRIKIEKGNPGELTRNEHVLLTNKDISQNIRLACQVSPEEDIFISFLSKAPESSWRKFNLDDEKAFTSYMPEFFVSEKITNKNNYGAAIDLGTTHIKINIHDLNNGKWLTGRYGLNPQLDFGSDIMSRIMAASESTDKAKLLTEGVACAIGEAFQDITTREGFLLNNIRRLVIVGNTAMLALLSGRNYSLLLKPENWLKPVDCLPLYEDKLSWINKWGINKDADILVVPPLAGFVGSDLLAGVMATGLYKRDEKALFIDFGTNSELALWDGNRLWVTSAAGGPAFEGSGLSCGMPAEPGAVYRLKLNQNSLDFNFIPGKKPRALCGSGLVDLISSLIRAEKLNAIGRFSPDIPPEGYHLDFGSGDPDLFLTRQDIDVFQRAKAAIGAAQKVLLKKAGIDYDSIEKLYVAGAFGNYLNIKNAIYIGLLPDLMPESIKPCGNAALIGTWKALISQDFSDEVKSFIDKATLVNLAVEDDFSDLFMENLYLKPL